MKKSLTRKLLAVSVLTLLFGASGTFISHDNTSPQFVKTDWDVH